MKFKWNLNAADPRNGNYRVFRESHAAPVESPTNIANSATTGLPR